MNSATDERVTGNRIKRACGSSRGSSKKHNVCFKQKDVAYLYRWCISAH